MEKDQNPKLEIFEEVLNATYPGLTLLFRDTNLGNLIDQYKIGMILREKGFTDSSKRKGGLITQHRIAILSNHYTDLTAYEQGTNWGLCVMNAGSRFKVLDRYTTGDKTQITLLHLPEQGWLIFENSENNLDAQLISKARISFDDSILLEPVPELTSSQWLDRCKFPIGMDDEGSYFSLVEKAE